MNANRPVTVLVVDDEAPIRHLVERITQKAGYATLAAADGPEALRLASTAGSIDLLITDMVMPAMKGDELSRRLRLAHPDLKVLYFTGQSDHLFERKGTMWEGEAFLEKPCAPRAILEALALLRNDNHSFAGVTEVPPTAGSSSDQNHG